MKDQKNPGATPEGNKSTPKGTEKTPGTNKSAETKTKGEEVWKNPDPTTPERKNEPDPTKPEKEKGPYSEKTNRVGSGEPTTPPKKNPAKTELNSDTDEEIGSLEEQDIDDQGITGEEDDDEQRKAS